MCAYLYMLFLRRGFFLKTQDLGIGVLYLLADGFWLSWATPPLASPPLSSCAGLFLFFLLLSAARVGRVRMSIV